MKRLLIPALMLAVFLLLGCSPTEPEPEPEPVVWVSEKILTTNGNIKLIAVTDNGAVYYAAKGAALGQKIFCLGLDSQEQEIEIPSYLTYLTAWRDQIVLSSWMGTEIYCNGTINIITETDLLPAGEPIVNPANELIILAESYHCTGYLFIINPNGEITTEKEIYDKYYYQKNLSMFAYGASTTYYDNVLILYQCIGRDNKKFVISALPYNFIEGTKIYKPIQAIPVLPSENVPILVLCDNGDLWLITGRWDAPQKIKAKEFLPNPNIKKFWVKRGVIIAAGTNGDLYTFNGENLKFSESMGNFGEIFAVDYLNGEFYLATSTGLWKVFPEPK